MPINADVARFLVSGAPPALPAEVVAEAKRALVNAAGAALFARDDPSVAILRGWAGRRCAGSVTSPLLWSAERAFSTDAVLVNAAQIHIADFDDTHRPTYVHTAAPILAVLIALAAQRRVRGEEVVRAYALAVEAELLYAELLFPSHYLRGFHITATVGAIGAAVAAALLSGHTEERLTQAIGLAMAGAGGLIEMLGSPGNAYQVGNSASIGLTAGELSGAGLDSVATAFDGDRGYLHAASDADPAVVAAAAASLGQRWRGLEVSYKAIATETITQAPVEAVLALRGRLAAHRRARLTGIEVIGKPIVVDVVTQRASKFGPYPAQPMQARFDIRYCVAAAWVRGQWTQAEVDAAALDDPQIRWVRDRVRISSHGRPNGNDVRVRLAFDDGTSEEQFVAAFRGSAENPMTNADLTAKLVDSAPDSASRAQARRAAALLWRLETLPDARVVVEALTGGASDAT
jgi:2-methylcitrate dehydratase PrpD